MTKIKKTFKIYNKGGKINNFSVNWRWGKPEWGEIIVKSPTLNSFPKEVTVEINPQAISDYSKEVKDYIEVIIDRNSTIIPVSFVTKEKPLLIKIWETFESILQVLGYILGQLAIAIGSLLVGLLLLLISNPYGWLIILIILAYIGNGTGY
jgi:hypothetical protein